MAASCRSPPATPAALGIGESPPLRRIILVADERIGEFLREAALFTHTSPAEGFPNSFLEAWSYGLPTITCFDPDGIITRERLGERHETFEAWEEAVVRWMSDPLGRTTAGASGRASTHATFTAPARSKTASRPKWTGLSACAAPAADARPGPNGAFWSGSG
jgi:hypothetical protein